MSFLAYDDTSAGSVSAFSMINHSLVLDNKGERKTMVELSSLGPLEEQPINTHSTSSFSSVEYWLRNLSPKWFRSSSSPSSSSLPGRSPFTEQFHLADMNECRADEDFFVFLFYISEGYSVPANVITDFNPFNCLPETLPENMWYFMNSMENKGVEGGFWDPSGEPREVFGDASIICWQETYEFYEGQGSDVKKTNWLMLEYYMTSKVPSEAASATDDKSLCKAFRSSSSPLSGSEVLQNQMQVDITSLNSMRRASSFILPSHPVENLPELDEFDPRDYIELRDLGIPQSPSSGSDNSSCVTMLSDECFDFLDALLDLEAESGDHVEHKDAGCDLVAEAAISGLPVEESPSENAIDGKAVDEDSSPPLTLDSRSSELSNVSQAPSAEGRNKTDGRLKKLKRKYLPGSSSQSSDGSNSGRAPSPGPSGTAKTDGTLKKLQKKYLCFMPF